MSRAPGTRIGPYEIVSMVGAGGMGEVYRARDPKLQRDVALKILPEVFASDSDRLARFQREARTLAALNHPHIAGIYGFEENAGTCALALEFVDGETLADRITRGPIPVDEALRTACQVAEALEAAHEQGIIHRDLKPANVVLEELPGSTAKDVRVKVLDFGIAKVMRAEADTSLGETILAGTEDGRILGTPAYMSPEQARGRPLDRRTDIWAFGCTLFEMLCGQRAFKGDSATETLVHVLEHQPDWGKLPPATPEPLRRLLRRCLQKDPHKRLHDIADARIELEELERATDSTPAPERLVPTGSRRSVLPWTIAAIAAVTAIAAGILYSRNTSRLVAQRLEIPVTPPADSRFSGTAPEFAISPDGRRIAFAASTRGVSRVWVRTLDNATVQAIPGTEGGRSPFWKPDSQTIGFFADHQLKTIQLDGGSPVIVCDMQPVGDVSVLGGTWSQGDVIIFAAAGGGPLWWVSARQGDAKAAPLTKVRDGDRSHKWPHFLPDGEHFLYLALGGATDELRIGSLGSSDTVSLGPFESHAAYASGRLYFVRGGNLMSQPFDAAAFKFIGDPTTVGPKVGIDPPWQRAMFSVSPVGHFAYSTIARAPSQLHWVDRRGRSTGTVAEPGVFFNLDLSWDDKHVAISQLKEPPGARGQFDIWLIDLDRDLPTRLTDDPGWDFDPAWSHDLKRVVFNSNRPEPGKSPYRLYTRASNGSGQDVLIKGADGSAPDWSRDGRFLLYVAPGSGGGDLWTVRSSGEGGANPFLSTVYAEGSPAFSPDGRWIAYHSNASGRNEIYVRPFPVREGFVTISREGGWSPRWRADGKEIFFLSLDGTMMSASVEAADNDLKATVPQPLFPTLLRPGHAHPYDVSSDGQRFLISVLSSSSPITWVVNGLPVSGR